MGPPLWRTLPAVSGTWAAFSWHARSWTRARLGGPDWRGLCHLRCVAGLVARLLYLRDQLARTAGQGVDVAQQQLALAHHPGLVQLDHAQALAGAVAPRGRVRNHAHADARLHHAADGIEAVELDALGQALAGHFQLFAQEGHQRGAFVHGDEGIADGLGQLDLGSVLQGVAVGRHQHQAVGAEMDSLQFRRVHRPATMPRSVVPSHAAHDVAREPLLQVHGHARCPAR